MTILVFGSSGQVGRELVRAGNVLALARSDADLSDPAAIADKIRRIHPAIVINAAAYTAVDRAEEEATLAQAVNGAAPGAMARACAEIDVPFLHISTDYVFDGTGEKPWKPGDTAQPIGIYGKTKLAGEIAVAAAGGRYAILRTSWVFSAHGANFVKTMLRLGAEHGSLDVVSDQVGGPTAAADIARALLRMAELFLARPCKSGIYHYSGAPDVSWANFAREVFAQANLAVQVREVSSDQYPTAAVRPANSRLYCSDLRREFAIVRPDWRLSLAEVLHELADLQVQISDG